MTINQLRQYRKLKGRMLLLETERDELILKSKVMDGTGSKSNITSDTVVQTVIERDKLQKDIEYLEQRLKAIEDYISQCDEYFGTMLKLHYIDGKTWTAIALKHGGNNKGNSLRMACYRFIEKNP